MPTINLERELVYPENISPIDTLEFDNIEPMFYTPKNKTNDANDSFLTKPPHTYEDEENDWLHNNQRLGDFGEKLALKALKDIYPETDIYLVSEQHHLGYDIQMYKNTLEMKAFEVKTASNHNGFHLTLNELKTAKLLGEQYTIFFIKLEKKNNKIIKANAYQYKDPIKTLDIPYDYITSTTNTKYVKLFPNKFYIELKKDFLNNTEIIQLSHLIESVNY